MDEAAKYLSADWDLESPSLESCASRLRHLRFVEAVPSVVLQVVLAVLCVLLGVLLLRCRIRPKQKFGPTFFSIYGCEYASGYGCKCECECECECKCESQVSEQEAALRRAEALAIAQLVRSEQEREMREEEKEMRERERELRERTEMQQSLQLAERRNEQNEIQNGVHRDEWQNDELWVLD
jgi:hypothetical protein